MLKERRGAPKARRAATSQAAIARRRAIFAEADRIAQRIGPPAVPAADVIRELRDGERDASPPLG
jgi:geranylgeranyl pyrophosphate synthase